MGRPPHENRACTSQPFAHCRVYHLHAMTSTTSNMITLTADTCYGREQIRVALAQATQDFYCIEKEGRKDMDAGYDVIGTARYLKQMVADVRNGSVTVDAEWLDWAGKMEVQYAEYRPKTTAEAIERAEDAHYRWTRFDDAKPWPFVTE